MWSRLLFAVYRHVFGLFIFLGFRAQKVYPLEPPVEETVRLIPFAARKPVADIPLLHDVDRFPAADRSRSRHRRIRLTRPLIGFLGHLKRPGIPPVPADHDEMMRIVYPYFFRKSWPHPPVVPPELTGSPDVLSQVAVAGPAADYIRSITPEDVAGIAAAGGSPDGAAYVIDLRGLAERPVRRGLEPIGCLVAFTVGGDPARLHTHSILYRDTVFTPGDRGWDKAERVALCSLTTHLSIVKHTVFIHLALVTTMAAITIDALGPDHPIRRLLHHCFQTALIGNYEVSQFQIRGKDAFYCSVFSYEYETMIEMINHHLAEFDVASMDPVEWARLRGVADPGFEYPFLDDVLPPWEIVEDYVATYVDHYFADETDVRADGALERWYRDLDDHLPGGVAGYAGPPGKEAVKRLCASLIYTSTVTHDNLNNIVWNYTTLPRFFPTVVPADGSLPRADLVFDFLTMLIGTWKPFNMLLDGISSLALDDAGRQIMDDFVAALRRLQVEMEARPFTHHTIYPANLNVSVTN